MVTPGAFRPGPRAPALETAAQAPQPPGKPTGFFPGWFVSPSVGWMTISKNRRGGLYKTTDGGATWTKPWPKYPGTTTTQFVDARDGFAVVDDMTTRVRSLYGTTDGGSSWKRVTDLIGP